jgi:hypothetical protein
MTSARILTNGSPGEKICHAGGVTSRGPLSLLLFLLVMEVLGALIRKADAWSLLQPFRARIPHRASFYADDLVLFISPNPRDIQMTHNILSVFEDASGLGCNLAKCQMALIRCNKERVELTATAFPYQVVDFLIRYLGIPLLVSKLPKSALQRLLDRVVDKLPILKGRLMH